MESLNQLIRDLQKWQRVEAAANRRVKDWDKTAHRSSIPQWSAVCQQYVTRYKKLSYQARVRQDLAKDLILANLAFDKTAMVKDSTTEYDVTELNLYRGFYATAKHITGGNFDDGINQLTFIWEVE